MAADPYAVQEQGYGQGYGQPQDGTAYSIHGPSAASHPSVASGPSSNEGTAAKDTSTVWVLVSFCLGIVGLLLVVIYLVTATLIKDTEQREGDHNVPSGEEMALPPGPQAMPPGPVLPTLQASTPGATPALPPLSTPPVARGTPPPAPIITFASITTTTSTSTTTTTTTTIPPLLCSVGLVAALPSHYPPDNTCDILIYTHVLVSEGKIRAVDNEISYDMFKAACARYADTTCGLSFDVRYISQDMFSTTSVRDEMAAVKTSSRINHYGIMNMYGTNEIVTNYTQLTSQIFQTLRSILGQDRSASKIIIGVGFFYYSNSDSWDRLKYLGENSATNDVDVLVLITSVLSIPDSKQCITMPVNALSSPNPFTPVMDKAFSAVDSSFGRRGLLVAFSLQMGVLQYVTELNYNIPIHALYKQCKAFTVTDYSQACQIDLADLSSEKTVIGFRKRQPNIFQSWDTLERMREKALIIMNIPNRRQSFTWFLFNVHLTDNTMRCLPDGPFSRLMGFREFLLQNP